MFESRTNINRKRFRWRKQTNLKRRNLKVIDIFIVICFLLLYGSSTAAGASISYNITENLPSGTAVGNVNEGGSSGFFIVSDQSEGVEDAFDLDLMGNGLIQTKMQLDRENINQYRMTLFNPLLSKAYDITVNVLDVNDNSPTFATEYITLEISELTSIGSEFNLGSALDEDAPPFNVQGYRLLGEDDYFGVNIKLLPDGSTRFAELVVLSELDRETKAYHTVIVEAFDGGEPLPKTGRVTVNVSISDSNDNPPVFESSLYNASISEDVEVGTDVITVKASDRDAGVNGDVYYSIDRGKSDPEELFRINRNSGTIFVHKPLDSETATEHSLTVLATDGGTQKQVGSTVVIVQIEDVNDNNPIISVIYLGALENKVSEGASVGHYVARISVTDPDVGDVEKFNVTLTGGDDKFGLRTENNVVYLVQIKQGLDREEKSSYDIILTATDFGSPPKSATTSITIEVIDVNDKSPEFDQDFYQVNISEESYPGTFVYHLSATDDDIGVNKEFEYILQTGSQSDWFHLNSKSGLVTTAKYLDYEVASEVHLTITARDFGIPSLSSSTTLQVNIGNANDTEPRFQNSEYIEDVPENTIVGNCFLQVSAIDPDHRDLNDQIRYSFAEDGDRPDEFSLGAIDGKVCLAAVLDRETISTYNFRIKATDKSGQHSFCRVVVNVGDVNDNRPEFHPVSYLTNVPAATSVVGNLVTRVIATDADDSSGNGGRYGVITYRILSGNEHNLFAIDNETGVVTIVQPLVSHGDTTVQLVIGAVDGGGLSAIPNAVVTISIINNTIASMGGPVFNQSEYIFNVREDASVDATVGVISAYAKDNAKVLYHLRSDPPMSDWFTIDSVTGILTVDSNLDREILSFVKLQIIASVGNPPIYGFCDVGISIEDVNDNAPVLHSSSPNIQTSSSSLLDFITIPATFPLSVKIYTVVASDADDGQNAMIIYSLNDDAGYFTIDSLSGAISLKKSLPSTNTNYSIVIKARDQGLPSLSKTETLVIQSLQEGGRCPFFSFDRYKISIPEDTKHSVGFFDISVSANVIYQVLPSLDSLKFGIFSDGALYLTSKLDREWKSRYQFEVAAQSVHSNAFSVPCVAMTTVELTVTDVNDNAPNFTSPATFSVKENAPSGTSVGVVTAVDNDSGVNAELRFSFVTANQFFAIGKSSGEITTAAVLDREALHSHSVVVQVKDAGNPSLISEMTILIVITDDNDQSPTFLYKVTPVLSVIQKKPQEQFVAVLQAIDQDIGLNSEIEYSIISEQKDLFTIDSHSGEVNAIGIEDTNIEYSLTIKAEDKGTPSQSSNIKLKVKIVDESANPAQFSESDYAFFAPANVRPGNTLGRFSNITAVSNRVKRRAEPESIILTNFYISEGNEDDAFYVDRWTGELKALRKLSYEDRPQYLLKVTAENSDDDSDIRAFEAQINVQDSNDFAPIFSKSFYSIAAREDVPVNTKVWKFTAVDHDIGQNGVVSYSIQNQTANSISPQSSTILPFRIDSSSGELYTSVLLDRETVPEYILVIKAMDGSSNDAKASSVSVIITVQDSNDNPPKFVSRDSVYLLEDEAVGFPVIYAVAEDDDLGSNSLVTYRITSQWSDYSETDENFQIDSSTGLISLMQRVDFERSPTHYLNISAIDFAALNPFTSYQLLRVHIIDINDETPEFQQDTYFGEVLESIETGSLIARVEADDHDSGVNGEITYELYDSSGTFVINSKTGVITNQKTLDRELVDSYVLIAYAHDGGSPSLYSVCTVQISVVDVNDNTPKFAADSKSRTSLSGLVLASVEVKENEREPVHVFTVLATDQDTGENGNITYSIQGGNTNDSFVIYPYSGQIWTTGQLDRETTSSYRLKLVITDNGDVKRSSEAFLDITVADSNDNAPNFTRPFYQASISEGLTSGHFVLTVHADDADDGLNSIVTYSIVPGTHEEQVSTIPSEGLFTINPDTGVITTTEILDREKQATHQFIVQAIDSAPYSPRKSSVLITVNVLDVNDNRPVFNQVLITKNVSRRITTGSEITSVSAEDKDNGNNATITYRISGGYSKPSISSWLDRFNIDNKGIITTTQSISDVDTYYLIITARDNGNPSLSSHAIVIVNVVPFSDADFTKLEFSHQSYTAELSETASKNHAVIEVGAEIIDDGTIDKSSIVMSYSIESGNEDDIFAINNDGSLTVKDSELLDYETIPQITLVVGVNATSSILANTLYAFTTILISIMDENDNAPKFIPEHYVSSAWEAQEQGMFVLKVTAKDVDSGKNKDIRYGIESGNTDNSFQINPTTGEVSTTEILDREVHDHYKISVTARDDGSPTLISSCTLEITVLDVNDDAPELYVPPPGALAIPENTEIGSLITTVTANDADTGDVTFLFALSDGNHNDYFTIDSENGEIHLARQLDYETLHQAIITVQATDGKHYDEKNVIVDILDFNDNAPIFGKQAYQVSLDELSAVGTAVATLHADDADSGRNSDVIYSLVDIIPKTTKFWIDSTSGTIYSNLTKSYNPHLSIYSLMIMASDNGKSPLNSTVPVRIEIKDINNNSPAFAERLYSASVSEAAGLNSHVINVSAVDADFSDLNRDVHYKIVSGNEGGMFKINTLTAASGDHTVGELSVAAELDREAVPSYTLSIMAYDRGSPVLSGSTTVTVTVDDVNDNPPYFNQSVYTASVREDSVGEPVVMVFAEDPDDSSSFIFKITAGDYNSAFEIGECQPPSTGCALISSIKLDYEETTSYNLSVQVWDGRDTRYSKSSVIPVKISVLDVNEFLPYFSAQLGFKRVSESVQANETILHIPGQDQDGGIFGDLLYTIVEDGEENSSGNDCISAEDMFYIVSSTGDVRTKLPLDYEKCHRYSFTIKVENKGSRNNRLSRNQQQTASYFPVEIEITSVDEYPPVFTSGNSNPFRFRVSYSAPAGYIVGKVNATDEDRGRDGVIVFAMDEDDDFAIDENTGIISLRQEISRHNSRVLTVTATSGQQSARTLVSIEIEGAPAIALETQILAIVFGIVAVIAIIVILVLCLKHRRNKKASRQNDEAVGRSSGNEFTEFHDPRTNETIPVAAPHLLNGNIKSNGSAQNHKTNNGKKTPNGVRHAATNGFIPPKSKSGTKIALPANGQLPKQFPVFPKKQAMIRNSLSSGRGSEQDDDIDVDREVDLINSYSDAPNTNFSTAPKVKTKKKVSSQGRNRKQVPDSGIQKDIDTTSDISDGTNYIKSPSVESIHVFREAPGEEQLNIQEMEEDLKNDTKNKLPIMTPDDPGHSKSDISSRYKSPLATDSNASNQSSLNSKRSEGGDSGYGRRGRLNDWAPEFQPLANVFSEVTKIKDRENASRKRNTFAMKDMSNAAPPDINGPPPLITSVAEQRSDLVAPVPLGFTSNRMQQRRNVGNNLAGLYPHPQYFRNPSHPPSSSYLPTMYSNVSKTPDMPRSHLGYNSNPIPVRPQVSFSIAHPNFGLGSSSVNSSQQGLSVSSLPRTPMSHESSFTSPALSPNLTPSLSPLATRSPSVSTVGDVGANQPTYDSDDGGHAGMSVSKSDPNLLNFTTDDDGERMVHV